MNSYATSSSASGSSTDTRDEMGSMEDGDTRSHAQSNLDMSIAAENDAPKLAQGETRAVVCLRLVVAVVLVGVALGVTLSVYLYNRSLEQEAFEANFVDNAIKIVDSFKASAERRVGAIDSLALSITSHALSSSNNDRWPMVTLPDFERRVTQTLAQAEVISLLFLPIVTNETRYMYETYTVYKQGWFLEGMAYQEELKSQRGEGTSLDEDANLEVLAQIGDGLDQHFQISPAIWGLSGLKAGPETGAGPYLPLWQVGLNITHHSTIVLLFVLPNIFLVYSIHCSSPLIYPSQML